MELFKMKLINQLQTNNTLIQVWLSEVEINNEKLYVIITSNKFTGKTYTRFGNKVQMDSIIKTYRLEKEFTL